MRIRAAALYAFFLYFLTLSNRSRISRISGVILSRHSSFSSSGTP